MVDPLRSFALRERLQQVVALTVLLVLAVFGAAALFWPPTYVTDGLPVEATVVRLGTYPVGEGRGGDLPILTVRLPDGSIRQVKASWSTAGRCRVGSRVPLVERGTALQVGLSGCVS